MMISCSTKLKVLDRHDLETQLFVSDIPSDAKVTGAHFTFGHTYITFEWDENR